MKSDRFILVHPVKAQRRIRELLPAQDLRDSPAMVLIGEPEDSNGCEALSTIAAHWSAAGTDLPITTASDPVTDDSADALFVAWLESEPDALVDFLGRLWAELLKLGADMRFFAALGENDYSAICTLRISPCRDIAIENEFYLRLSKSKQAQLRELGYQKTDQAEMSKQGSTIWSAFLEKINSREGVAPV